MNINFQIYVFMFCIRHEAYMNRRKKTERERDRETDKQTFFY